jgi:hypothetical protein
MFLLPERWATEAVWVESELELEAVEAKSKIGLLSKRLGEACYGASH